MHRENLVVTVRSQHAGLRLRQLQAHQHGENSAKREKYECGDDIAPPDDLVVHGCERAPKALGCVPDPCERGLKRRPVQIRVTDVALCFAVPHFRLAK